MIGIDTNVLLRFFQADGDSSQIESARRLIRTEAPVFVNPIVLAEFAWTLRSTFKLKRAAIHDRLAGIVEAPEFSVSQPEATGRAVAQFATGPADFADYLVGELNVAFGCSETVTFDKDATKAPAFRNLS